MIKIAHLIMLFTTVRMLLDKGADPHVRNAKNAIILWTAVSNAYKYCHNARSVEIVKMLLQKKKMLISKLDLAVHLRYGIPLRYIKSLCHRFMLPKIVTRRANRTLSRSMLPLEQRSL